MTRDDIIRMAREAGSIDSEDVIETVYAAFSAAPVVYWLDPDEEPPPVARKLLLLTEGGVACIGHWGDDCVAWAPLPKVPASIKEKMLRR
jgi:hypothetical protein